MTRSKSEPKAKKSINQYEVEALNYIYGQCSPPLFVATLISTLTAIVLWKSASHALIIIWVSAIFIIYIARFYVCITFKKQAQEAVASGWLQTFIYGALISGLLFGLSAVFLFPENSKTDQLFLCLVLCGMSAGSVSTYSALKLPSLAFIVPTVLPITVRFFLMGTMEYLFIALMSLAYLLFLLATIFQNNKIFVRSFELSQENQKLVLTLTEEKRRTDLTNIQLKEAVEKAGYQAELAKAAAKAKDEFLANVSHELRTPLGSVIGMNELVLDTKLDDEQRDCLIISSKAAKGLLYLVDKLLHRIDLEEGKLSAEKVTINIKNFFGDIFLKYERLAKEKNLEASVEWSDWVPEQAILDENKLRQILGYLLENAVKFTREGSVSLSLHFNEMLNNKAKMRVKIFDTGIGIPQEKQEEVFNVFTQGDGSASREYEGLGLGLSSARQLISLLGGDLRVNSQEGVGSEFSFNINVDLLPGGVAD